MITGTLSSGFKYNIDETIADEWEFTRAIGLSESKKQGEKLYGMTQVISMLLGSEGEEELIKHIKKNNNGKCTSEHMYAAIVELLKTIKDEKELKNSESSPE